MLICPNCNSQYGDQTSVCPECGAELVPEGLVRAAARVPENVRLPMLANWAIVCAVAFLAPFALYVAAYVGRQEQSFLFNFTASLYVLGVWFWLGYLLRNFRFGVLAVGLAIPALYWLYTGILGHHPNWQKLIFWSFALPATAAATMLSGQCFGKKPRAIFVILPLLCVALVAYLYMWLLQPPPERVVR